LKRVRRTLAAERGASIVEELVAVTIVAAVAVTALLGLSTASLGTFGQRERTVAEALLIAQAESIKAASYRADGAYATVATPGGYTVALSAPASTGVTGLDRLTITVSGGRQPSRVLTLLKGDR
jgi:type II secretory pathway pseudopilin PulG